MQWLILLITHAPGGPGGRWLGLATAPPRACAGYRARPRGSRSGTGRGAAPWPLAGGHYPPPSYRYAHRPGQRRRSRVCLWPFLVTLAVIERGEGDDLYLSKVRVRQRRRDVLQGVPRIHTPVSGIEVDPLSNGRSSFPSCRMAHAVHATRRGAVADHHGACATWPSITRCPARSGR
jgi:hypothetical protein